MSALETNLSLSEISAALDDIDIDSSEPVLDPASYRIPFDQTNDWREHLKNEGFVVVSGVIGTEELSQARAMVWDWVRCALFFSFRYNVMLIVLSMHDVFFLVCLFV
jgi:hypothetical protein